jgi:hypothetical protein
MINVLRQVNEYQLYIHELTNMYAVSDDNNVSLWFDSFTKDELIELNDNDFVILCKYLIKED